MAGDDADELKMQKLNTNELFDAMTLSNHFWTLFLRIDKVPQK